MRIGIFTAAAFLIAAAPAMAQAAPNPPVPIQHRTAQYRDHCASLSGQTDPRCIVADTGSSTYRDSDAAGWNGTGLWEKTGR